MVRQLGSRETLLYLTEIQRREAKREAERRTVDARYVKRLIRSILKRRKKG